eukprot:6437292-Prymnesium_polylepis.1
MHTQRPAAAGSAANAPRPLPSVGAIFTLSSSSADGGASAPAIGRIVSYVHSATPSPRPRTCTPRSGEGRTAAAWLRRRLKSAIRLTRPIGRFRTYI